jgi:molybdate transport system regulatory protein
MATAAERNQARRTQRRQSRPTLRPHLRLVVGEDIAIGPGKAELLRLIAETGSIAAAGRAMGMSYKRAWMLVTTMNRCFATPLVAASRGGSSRGGAEITEAGEAVLAAYDSLAEEVDNSSTLAEIRKLLRRR